MTKYNQDFLVGDLITTYEKLLRRREKQLKRVIKSARKWHDDALALEDLLEEASWWYEPPQGPEDI